MKVSVFSKPTAEYPTFGTLRYGSAYWEGTIHLEPFGGSFPIIVRAKREGPSASQVAAMSRVVSEAASIKALASAGMVEVHEESELLPSGVGPHPETIWQHLAPSQIEVCDETYYGDGRIAVLLIFEASEQPDFAPAIETADGTFVEVLSGT